MRTLPHIRVRDSYIDSDCTNLRFHLLSFLIFRFQSQQSFIVKSRVGERHEEQLKHAEELIRLHTLRFLAEQLQRLLTLDAKQQPLSFYCQTNTR